MCLHVCVYSCCGRSIQLSCTLWTQYTAAFRLQRLRVVLIKVPFSRRRISTSVHHCIGGRSCLPWQGFWKACPVLNFVDVETLTQWTFDVCFDCCLRHIPHRLQCGSCNAWRPELKAKSSSWKRKCNIFPRLLVPREDWLIDRKAFAWEGQLLWFHLKRRKSSLLQFLALKL